jgi:hypothetical protein
MTSLFSDHTMIRISLWSVGVKCITFILLIQDTNLTMIKGFPLDYKVTGKVLLKFYLFWLKPHFMHAASTSNLYWGRSLSFTSGSSGWEPSASYQCLCRTSTCLIDSPLFTLFVLAYSNLFKHPFIPTFHSWSARPSSISAEESYDSINIPFVELPFDTGKKMYLVTEKSTHVRWSS